MQGKNSARTVSSMHGYHKMRPLSSLRFRLTCWYFLILTIILCAFSAVIYVTQERALYRNADTDLQPIIQSLPDLYQSGHFANKNIGLYAYSTITVLLGPQGQIIQALGRPITPDLYQLPIHFILSSSTIDYQVSFNTDANASFHFSTSGDPVIDSSAPLPWKLYAFEVVSIYTLIDARVVKNYVLVGLYTAIPEEMSQLLDILLLLTPLALLVSSVGGYWLASKSTRPVQSITRAAREINATDLHRRLNLKRHDELGELATTFDCMLDRLEGAFARQRQFTADASHELRTPLSIVNAEVERVLQRPRVSEEYIQSMEIVQQEGQRMSRLVDGLLTLARADQGQASLKYERIDLSEIIVDVAERLAPLAEQNASEIRLSGLDEIFVWGDRLYLAQLCTNLLENALKYGVGEGQYVEVKLERQQDRVHIQFIDNGPGIGPEHLPHLFERFYRVDQARFSNWPMDNVNSNGLGLAIAQWIAQEHGGSIHVQSTLGKGTTFDVYFPI